MSRRLLVIGLSFALAIIVVATVLSPRDNSNNGSLSDGTSQYGTSSGNPTTFENKIYDQVEEALFSHDNPANRDIPEEFLKPDRDEKTFQEWTLEALQLGIEFQKNASTIIGESNSLEADEVIEIHKRVRDWRQAYGVSLD